MGRKSEVRNEIFKNSTFASMASNFTKLANGKYGEHTATILGTALRTSLYKNPAYAKHIEETCGISLTRIDLIALHHFYNAWRHYELGRRALITASVSYDGREEKDGK